MADGNARDVEPHDDDSRSGVDGKIVTHTTPSVSRETEYGDSPKTRKETLCEADVTMRKSKLYEVFFIFGIIFVAQAPMWFLASDIEDMTEARASLSALAVATVTAVGLILREYFKYKSAMRRKPGEIQRRTKKKIGPIRIIEDNDY